MNDDQLIITIAGMAEYVSVDSFLSVVSNTLDILKDLDAAITRRRQGTIAWHISSVGMNSPLTLTVFAESEEETDVGREVINAYTEGLRKIEANPDSIPDYFSDSSLERAKRLVTVLNEDISRITFATPWSKPVAPSQRLAANVDDLLSKEHEELGTFEGRLETLSIHGGTTFNIWDVVSGVRITCRFPREKLGEAYAAFGHRVAVHGKVRYSRAGRPLSINVVRIRRLREQSELPQAKDLEGINIAGGLDPVDYVRSLRDAE